MQGYFNLCALQEKITHFCYLLDVYKMRNIIAKKRINKKEIICIENIILYFHIILFHINYFNSLIPKNMHLSCV